MNEGNWRVSWAAKKKLEKKWNRRGFRLSFFGRDLLLLETSWSISLELCLPIEISGGKFRPRFPISDFKPPRRHRRRRRLRFKRGNVWSLPITRLLRIALWPESRDWGSVSIRRLWLENLAASEIFAVYAGLCIYREMWCTWKVATPTM